MDLPDKHQLKFNIHKDAKSLIETIEKRVENSHSNLEEQDRFIRPNLDAIFNNLKIYEAEVKSSSSTSPTTQNIAFVSSQNTDSTNESVSAVTSVSAASTKVPVSTLPNLDNLSDAIIYSIFSSQSNNPQLENDDLKQIDANDLEEIDLKWQMTMLTMRARRRRHFTRKCRLPKDTRNKDTQRRNVSVETSTSNALVSKCDGIGSNDWRFQADEKPTNYALNAFTSSCSSSSDNEVAPCSKACSKAYGYDNQVFNSTVFDYDELISSESDIIIPTSPVHDRYKSGEGYHVVPPPYTRTFMPPEPNLDFHDALTTSKTVPAVFPVKPNESEGKPMPTQKASSFVHTTEHVKTPRPSIKPVEHPILVENLRKDILKSRGHRHSWNRKACFVCKSLTHLIKDCDYYEKKIVQKPIRNHEIRENHQHYARMTHPHPHRHVVLTPVLTRSRLVPLTAARHVTTVGVQGNGVWKPKCPVLDHVSRHTSNPQHTLKAKGVIDSGCLRHMTGNISYLSDFEEINGGYVAFGKNPKGGKITCKDTECIILSSDFKLPDEIHVLLRVPRENNMYNVDLKNIVSSGNLTWLLVIKAHNKTPYELLHGITPNIGFIIPFGCLVTILNTLDALGKFDGKTDEGFLVRYSVSSKAFRLFNSRTRIVQETLHINFLENQPNVAASGPTWLFDIETLTQSMNYRPVVIGNQPNSSAGIQETLNACTVRKEATSVQQYVLLPLWSSGSKDPQNTDNVGFEVTKTESAVHVSPSSYDKTKKHNDKKKERLKTRVLTNEINAASTPVIAVRGNFSNLETNITISPIPTTNVHKDHLVTQIIGDLSSAPQTRKEPKRVHQALKDPSWIEAMQEELLQFKMQKVYVQVDLPKGKRFIGSKWVFRNKKDERGIVIRNKTRLVAQGHTQEEGINYEEVFAPVARIEAIRLFLAYASFMGFMVYQMDVKVLFFMEPLKKKYMFVNLQDLKTLIIMIRFTKWSKHSMDCIKLIELSMRHWPTIFWRMAFKGERLIRPYLSKAFKKLMKDNFQMSLMGELTFFLGLQVKQKQDGIFISQDKYVAEILRKFGLTDGKSASIPIYTEKPLLKDPDAEDQFWTSVLIKKSNDVVRLQALIDQKMVIMIEDSIRKALRLDDADSVDCLTNEEIFVELATMGYEKPFKKLTFYKAFFSAQSQDVEDATEDEDDVNEVSVESTPPSPTPATPPPPPQQEHIPRGGCIQTGGKVAELDADEDVTLEEVDADVTKDADCSKKKKGVIIQDPEKVATASVSVQSKLKSKDKGKRILVEEPKPLKRQAQIEQDEAFARELEVELNANINWNDMIDQVKRKERQDNTVMRYQALKRKQSTCKEKHDEPQFYLGFSREMEIEEEESKRKSENLKQKATKKQKINKETEELKTHLHIFPNDEANVYTEANPLALKVPVVEYQIHHEHDKPFYKIIRADGTHQLFLSFITLLRNFDKEDLEML
nr:hypothetical protein [Tanacetum cinerariifolium]